MRPRGLVPALCAAMAAAALTLCAQDQPTPPQPNPPAQPGATELDHVVAIVGPTVILQSDVEQEMHLSALEPLQVLPGENTPARALRRLIDRTLILEQMKEQLQPVNAKDENVEKAIAQLRKEIPACAQYHCGTEEGWDDFLRTNDLDAEMVRERWSQRMAILHFVDLRFRSGIRISSDQISAYYEKTLVPALAKEHQTAPALADVTGRIQEVLLEQQVSGLFEEWLGSLRGQGNIRVVDQGYSADLAGNSGPAGGETSQ